MPKLKLRGVIVPLLTPFGADGMVDEVALRLLASNLFDRGVNGLMLCGTTGEGPLLTVEERKRVAEVVVDQVAGAVPVVVHTGAISTAETVTLSVHADAIGADALTVCTPYYYQATADSIYQHFAAVCNAVPERDVYLYNIPQCTGNALSFKDVHVLARDFSNIAGIKDSSGDLMYQVSLLGIRDGDFNVVVGNDGLIASALVMGVEACVSGNANVFPELFLGLFDAFSAHDLDRVRKLQTHIDTIRLILQDGSDLSLYKALVSRQGMGCGAVRPPLIAASEETIELKLKQLEEVGLVVGQPL